MIIGRTVKTNARYTKKHNQLNKQMTIVPASVAQVTETQNAPTGTVCRKEPGSIPGSAGRFRIRIPEAHALKLISRIGKKVRWCPL